MKILFATTNEGKLREARAALKGIEVEALKAEIEEIKSLDARETIEKKAKAAYNLAKKPVVAEDTCLYFKAFKDFPGTYTKFIYKTIGLNGCLKLLEGKRREAEFVTLVAYADGRQTKILEGRAKGRITERPKTKTDEKLPYDSVFIPDGFNKVYGLMTEEEQAKVKHRAKAFAKLREWLEGK